MLINLDAPIYAMALKEWLGLHRFNPIPAFSARGAGRVVRNIGGAVSEQVVAGEVTFYDPVPNAVLDALGIAVGISVYRDVPAAGDITVEFTVSGATGSVEIRVYDEDDALVSSVTDTFDAAGVVGLTLQQPAAGTYYVVLWRQDLPPVYAQVDVT